MKPVFALRRVDAGGVSHRFPVYVQPQYSDQRQWPAVVFLHGAGERGETPIAPTTVGIGPR